MWTDVQQLGEAKWWLFITKCFKLIILSFGQTTLSPSRQDLNLSCVIIVLYLVEFNPGARLHSTRTCLCSDMNRCKRMNKPRGALWIVGPRANLVASRVRSTDGWQPTDYEGLVFQIWSLEVLHTIAVRFQCAVSDSRYNIMHPVGFGSMIHNNP